MSLWARENLHAWCVVGFDAKRRGPDERAEMLAELGFRAFAYGPGHLRLAADSAWHEVVDVDAEIAALRRYGIELRAWWLAGPEAEDPRMRERLDAFERHGVRPQLWIMQSLQDVLSELARQLPTGAELPSADRSADVETLTRQAFEGWTARSLATTPEQQEEWVERETDRIAALVEMAAPSGCQVVIYNHKGWLGIVENQLAVIERLERRGVRGVGMAYNFSHARSAQHDDTEGFPALWDRMKAHVVALNIAGIDREGNITHPGEGDFELEMMRAVQASGWTGPVGVIAETGGDAEESLRDALDGLDRLAAELA